MSRRIEVQQDNNVPLEQRMGEGYDRFVSGGSLFGESEVRVGVNVHGADADERRAREKEVNEKISRMNDRNRRAGLQPMGHFANEPQVRQNQGGSRGSYVRAEKRYGDVKPQKRSWWDRIFGPSEEMLALASEAAERCTPANHPGDSEISRKQHRDMMDMVRYNEPTIRSGMKNTMKKVREWDRVEEQIYRNADKVIKALGFRDEEAELRTIWLKICLELKRLAGVGEGGGFMC